MAADTFPSSREALRAIAECDDPQAWLWLVQTHADLVHRTCLRAVRRESLAEDAVQETFLQLRRVAGKFDAGTADDAEDRARAWIHRIAGNCALMLLRQEQRRHQRHRAAPTPVGTTQDATIDAELVHLALAELPEAQRHPLVLHFFSGLDYDELATALGCSTNYARVKVHRALKKLRKLLLARGCACTLLAVTTTLEAASAQSAVHIVGPGLVCAEATPRLALATSSLIGAPMSFSPLLLTAGLLLASSAAIGAVALAAEDAKPTDNTGNTAVLALEPEPDATTTGRSTGFPLLETSMRLQLLASGLVRQHGRPLSADLPAAAQDIERLYSDRQFAACLQAAEDHLRQKPGSPALATVRYLQARSLEALGRTELALPIYNEIHDLFPDQAALACIALHHHRRLANEDGDPATYWQRIAENPAYADQALAWLYFDCLPPTEQSVVIQPDLPRSLLQASAFALMSAAERRRGRGQPLPRSLFSEVNDLASALHDRALFRTSLLHLDEVRAQTEEMQHAAELRWQLDRAEVLVVLGDATGLDQARAIHTAFPQHPQAIRAGEWLAAQNDAQRPAPPTTAFTRDLFRQLANRHARSLATSKTSQHISAAMGHWLYTLPDDKDFDPTPWGLLAARCYLSAGQPDQAILLFEHLERDARLSDQQQAEVSYWHGSARLDTEQAKAAVAIWQKLIHEQPDSKWARYARGRLTGITAQDRSRNVRPATPEAADGF